MGPLLSQLTQASKLALLPVFSILGMCRPRFPRAARFSPDDKFSRHRVTIKKRYGILLTQQPAEKL